MGFIKGIAGSIRNAIARVIPLRGFARVLGVLVIASIVAGGVWVVGWATRGAEPGGVSHSLQVGPFEPAQTSLESEYGASLAREEAKGARTDSADRVMHRGGEHESLEQLVKENDIWRTAAQNARRWEVAKMAALSRMIGEFPGIRSASVIFDPGTPRRLGSAGTPATAAVNVSLESASSMSPTLVAGIADLVSGSIAGLDRKEVRIVDSTGRSYRADRANEEALARERREDPERIRAAEADYAAKIRTMLSYIDGLVVVVHIEPEPTGERRISASVSLPRMHLLSVHRSRGGTGDVDDEQLAEEIRAYLGKIRGRVAHLIGAEGPNAVRVDWYSDALAEAESSEARAPSGELPGLIWLRANAQVLGGVGSGVLLVAGLGLLVRRRRRRFTRGKRKESRTLRGSEPQIGRETTSEQVQGDEQAGDPEGSLLSLRDASVEELVTLAGGESPQTIALILGEMEAVRGAGVLRSLDYEVQVEVIRKLAELEGADERVLRDLKRGLSIRLAQLAKDRTTRDGAVRRIAGILHESGYEIERSLLDGLSADAPGLVETIRERIFAFEDIARVPRRELRLGVGELDSKDLAVALRTAGSDVKRRILGALSPRAARRVRRDMQEIGPVRLSDVEAAQRGVVEAIRQNCQGLYVSHSSETAIEPGTQSSRTGLVQSCPNQ